jgi:phospholipase/carboxylesterase
MTSSGTRLDTVEVSPPLPARASVILMHGLGADGHDFESLVPELHMPEATAIRWVFPDAPVRPVTLNGGVRMRAWYDIVSIDRRAVEDEVGIRESADGLRALVRRERERGIPARRIVLAGFSQGGAMALFTALREAERLAGVLALSTYLPLARTLAAEAHPANAAVSIFMAHGTLDPIVPLSLGEASRDRLRSRGYEVEWRTYAMAHGVCAEEVADVRQWLLRVLPPPDPGVVARA